MLEKLFNIFKKKSAIPEIKSNKNAICKLQFDIHKDGTIDIICHWPEFDHTNHSAMINIAYFYALAIEAINSGVLEKEILDTLQKNTANNEYDTLFVHNVIYKLYELEKTKKHSGDISKQPLVHPLDVFKNTSS